MIYLCSPASTFNITILINLAPKRQAPKSHVGLPEKLYIYPPKFPTTFSSNLHQNSYYLFNKIFPLTFLAVYSYMLHVHSAHTYDSIFHKVSTHFEPCSLFS